MIFVRELLAVIGGGMLGTGLRFAIDSLLPHDASGFPVSTFIVNVVGSLVLAYLVARVWPAAKPWLRAGLGAGMLGSFTTFSALAVSLVQLGVSVTGIVYLILSLVFGFAAAFAGLRLGSRRAVAIDEVNE
jgi:fluoride exporter